VFRRTGVSIMGKRMFDLGERMWPEEAPFHTPVFVLTSQVREPWVRPGGTTFYFVNDGIESALRQARAAAGDRDIRIAGGADAIQQYLRAGVADEFTLAISPVMFGGGRRLFEGIGREAIAEHEQALTGYAVDKLSRIPEVQVVPGGQHRLSVISFNVDGVHPHDVGTVLDQHGVAVRVGHHCAQPLMDKLGILGTVRASLGVYNDEADLDRLAEAVEACREMFRL